MREPIQLFPIFGTSRRDGSKQTIPMKAILPYEDRCIEVHGKTFAELAEEHGLTYMALYCLVKDMTWDEVCALKLSDKEIKDQLFETIGLKKYVVPVEWMVSGYAAVYACGPEDACQMIHEDNDHISVPTSPYMQYIEDSFAVCDYPDNIEEGAEMCKFFTSRHEQGNLRHLLNYL